MWVESGGRKEVTYVLSSSNGKILSLCGEGPLLKACHVESLSGHSRFSDASTWMPYVLCPSSSFDLSMADLPGFES